MAKKPNTEAEGFGEVQPRQMVSPLSFQSDNHGTPEHPCDMIPEMDATPDLYEIADPLSLSKRGK